MDSYEQSVSFLCAVYRYHMDIPSVDLLITIPMQLSGYQAGYAINGYSTYVEFTYFTGAIQFPAESH